MLYTHRPSKSSVVVTYYAMYLNFSFQVLANSIVQGKFAEKHVPLHVRQIISCERFVFFKRVAFFFKKIIHLFLNTVVLMMVWGIRFYFWQFICFR